MSFDFPSSSLIKVPLKYGLVGGFVFCIQINIQHLFRNSAPELVIYSAYIFLPVLFLIIFLGLNEKRRLYDRQSAYLDTLKNCLLISLFTAVSSCFFMLVYNEYINNDLVDLMRDRFISDLQAQDIAPELIKVELKNMLQPFSTTWLIKRQFLITLLFGTFFSLCAPLIAKSLSQRKKNTTF